ncbi:MAG: hypothetical protein OXP71_13475 [Candidatus Poribacteria bacterium]|nr:hypothetical protein [Candidatus Poribacteria bacterium]
METFISSVETSIQPPRAFMRGENTARQTPSNEPSGEFTRQKEITTLKSLICVRDARIEQLTQENKYLYAELDQLRAQGEDGIKKSDALIEQMQAASEESSKRADAIIMQLSKQVENQAEHIEILKDYQGIAGAIRQLKSKLPFLRTKRNLKTDVSVYSPISIEEA